MNALAERGPNHRSGRIAAVIAIAAVLAVAAIAWTIGRRDDDGSPASESTLVTESTPAPVATSTTSTTSTTVVPEDSSTSAPALTEASAVTEAPAVTATTPVIPDPGPLYAATDDPGTQRVIDARTGTVIRVEPVDDALSQAYRPAYVPPRVDNAAGTYRFEWIRSPAMTDACGQSQLNIFANIEGTPDVARTVPTHAFAARLTPDGRELIVVTAQCPATVPAELVATIERFPADGPAASGEVLATISAPVSSDWAVDVDDSGRYLLVSSFAFGDPIVRAPIVTAFDLRTGDGVDVLGGCSAAIAPELRMAAGSMWEMIPQEFIAGSTLALTTVCLDGSHHAIIVDLADPETLIDLLIPTTGMDDLTTIELDRSGLTVPASAWFVVRVTDASGENRRAFIGQGAQPLRALDGITDPTFQPLWSPGG